MAQVRAHVEGQQHPIKLYLVVWGWLFVLSTCSFLVDYFDLQGYLRWFLILLFMIVKAGLIVAIFMHMAWERLALMYAILVPPGAVLLFVAIMAFESDYTHFTRSHSSKRGVRARRLRFLRLQSQGLGLKRRQRSARALRFGRNDHSLAGGQNRGSERGFGVSGPQMGRGRRRLSLQQQFRITRGQPAAFLGDADRHDFKLALVNGTNDGCGGEQRDLVLSAPPPEKDANAQFLHSVYRLAKTSPFLHNVILAGLSRAVPKIASATRPQSTVLF